MSSNPYPGDYLLGASSSASTLTMSDEQRAAALERERRRGTFGFGRVLDDDARRAQDGAQRGSVDGDTDETERHDGDEDARGGQHAR